MRPRPNQEFDLISKQPGPLNWILGAFYLRDNTPTYLNLYTAPPGPPPPFTIRTQPTEKSYAVFGQATYSFTDRWQLLLGARENRNDKSQAGTQTLTLPTGLPAPAPATVPVVIPLTASVRTTTPTGKAALSFFADPDTTIYVSASRGFKAGGANAGDLVNLIFQPEKINAYEGGYKADFLNRRLRVAAAGFYYDYHNMQITALDASGQQSIVNCAQGEDLRLRAGSERECRPGCPQRRGELQPIQCQSAAFAGGRPESAGGPAGSHGTATALRSQVDRQRGRHL